MHDLIVEYIPDGEGSFSDRPYLGTIGNQVWAEYNLIIDTQQNMLYLHRFAPEDPASRQSLYDYGFRDYSPVSARFTTIDPIRDGSNWFSYVVNDPVNYCDPFGLTASDSRTVRSGDTLGNMTWQYNKENGTNYTAAEVAEFNGIANPNLIYPGQTINFPGGASGATQVSGTPSTPTTSQTVTAQTTSVATQSTAPAPTVYAASVPIISNSAPPVSNQGKSNNKSYLQRSLEQVVYGNYTDEVTLLGTGVQILMGALDIDILADIRDLSADFVKWEWSKQHFLQTGADLLALFPVLGLKDVPFVQIAPISPKS